MPRKPRVRREDLAPGECLCDHCVGKCCRYFSLPIETPTTWDDYDSIRWYLAHGQTIVYVEKGTWYLVVLTRCQYLDARNHCRIYHDRPRICRDYTTDECEYDEDWVFTKVFESPEQIWEYAEALLPPRRRAKAPSAADGILLSLGPPPIEPSPRAGDNARSSARPERS
ncbi:MAG: YkgJ family cysteine cluster protein [Isosphaeraceae bacterium]